MSTGMVTAVEISSIAFNTALCAYVMARGGTREDLVRMERILGPRPPKHNALDIWDDFEDAWARTRRG